MPVEQPEERDFVMMDEILREARNSLAEGSAGVAALLSSPDEIIAEPSTKDALKLFVSVPSLFQVHPSIDTVS
jgi:hypothetical protein